MNGRKQRPPIFKQVLTRADVTEKIKACLRYDDEDRPRGSIDHKLPVTLQNSGGAPGPSQ